MLQIICTLLLATLGYCQTMPPEYELVSRKSPGGDGSAEKFLHSPSIEIELPSTALPAIRSIRPEPRSFVVPSSKQNTQGFRWKRALFESFTFFAMEQSYLVHDEYHWIAVSGMPFNHYWSDYKTSLSTWAHSGWSDGDPFLDNYIGHPIQGALTGYIQVQNDPRGEKLEFSTSKAYWRSRLKAMLWSAAYSTQWEIGPLSELTIEKYGSARRPKWNRDGSFPCTSKDCVTGTGMVDLVITPLGGLGWMVAEDILDKEIARRIERKTRNKFVVGVTRCALNPIRSAANILHGKSPWHRASRDHEVVSYALKEQLE